LAYISRELNKCIHELTVIQLGEFYLVLNIVLNVYQILVIFTSWNGEHVQLLDRHEHIV